MDLLCTTAFRINHIRFHARQIIVLKRKWQQSEDQKKNKRLLCKFCVSKALRLDKQIIFISGPPERKEM